jgi:hypothetical protein
LPAEFRVVAAGQVMRIVGRTNQSYERINKWLKY